MTSKASAGRKTGLFLTPEMNIRLCETDVQVSPRKRVVKSHSRGANAKFIDGIVNGERVLIATEPAHTERGIEIQIRVAVASAGIMCMKHDVSICPHCGGVPKQSHGLGLGCADLICVVPPYGRFLAIECKRPTTKNAKRDEHQRQWMGVVRRYGGIAGVASNVDEAFALIALARRLP